MSLEYYLFCRKRYDNIINYLKGIINEKELLLNEEVKLKNEHVNLSYGINEYKNDIIFYIELRNNNEKKIYDSCKHIFEDDYIDITPERSEKITYCSICECSK